MIWIRRSTDSTDNCANFCSWKQKTFWKSIAALEQFWKPKSANCLSRALIREKTRLLCRCCPRYFSLSFQTKIDDCQNFYNHNLFCKAMKWAKIHKSEDKQWGLIFKVRFSPKRAKDRFSLYLYPTTSTLINKTFYRKILWNRSLTWRIAHPVFDRSYDRNQSAATHRKHMIPISSDLPKIPHTDTPHSDSVYLHSYSMQDPCWSDNIITWCTGRQENKHPSTTTLGFTTEKVTFSIK